MTDCEKVKKLIEKYYGEKVICGKGSNCAPVYSLGSQNTENVDIIVYIHERNGLAIVWNCAARRENNRRITHFNVFGQWNTLLPDRGEIRGIYKKMGIHKDDPDEKVLVLSVENLLSIYPRLYEYMQLNPFDTEYPSQGKIRTDSRVIKDVRERVSVSRWDRDRHFREEVLASYNNKCAICRCQEISLLQAAHIEPVACGGNDDKSNGISLCANHHLMLDNGLIEIDFMTRRLSYVEDTVKKMPWYEEFNTKYQGKIMEQQ